MYSNPSNLLGGTSNVSLSGDGTTQDPFSISVTEVDGSTTNEIQTLLISGNQLSISDGNTITIAHPTLTVTKETIGYIFSALHHSGGNGNGAILYKNNIKTTGNPKTGRISAGSYTVIFNSAHPDGDNYHITLGVQKVVAEMEISFRLLKGHKRQMVLKL